MSNHNETFTFTYSASQQEEVNRIRRKYLSHDGDTQIDKLEQLRRLDASVTKKAMIPALAVGIIGTLVMGMGMSLVMSDIGAYLGVTSTLIPGIVTGLVGMAGVIIAYPLYNWILTRQRRKTAPQVLQLADELSQQ